MEPTQHLGRVKVRAPTPVVPWLISYRARAPASSGHLAGQLGQELQGTAVSLALAEAWGGQ